MHEPAITPDLLLQAYAMGVFPMAEARGADRLHWIDPRRRGIFPLERFHVGRSLRRRILRCGWEVAIDRDPAAVIDGCAAREETWINDGLRSLYLALAARGALRTVEVREGGALVGGLFGLTLGGAFFGESMFSQRTDASKVALAWCIHRLRAGGFTLFDTQFLTPHLASLGAIEIPRAEYHARLARAIGHAASFAPRGYAPTPADIAGRAGGEGAPA
jgi:leucyl/phenylalanyl-tRNA--protein transferase